jgi:hypothetical protein
MMHKLTDFAWYDDNQALHIDVPRMLERLGVQDTPANRDRYSKIAAEHLAVLLKDTPAIIKITP